MTRGAPYEIESFCQAHARPAAHRMPPPRQNRAARIAEARSHKCQLYPPDYALTCAGATHLVRTSDMARVIPGFAKYHENSGHLVGYEFAPGPIHGIQLAKLADYIWTNHYSFLSEDVYRYPITFTIDDPECEGCNNWCRFLKAHLDMFHVGRYLKMLGLQTYAMKAFAGSLVGAPLKVLEWAVINVYEFPHERLDQNGGPCTLGTIPDYRQHFILPAMAERCEKTGDTYTPSEPKYNKAALAELEALYVMSSCFREDILAWAGWAGEP